MFKIRGHHPQGILLTALQKKRDLCYAITTIFTLVESKHMSKHLKFMGIKQGKSTVIPYNFNINVFTNGSVC